MKKNNVIIVGIVFLLLVIGIFTYIKITNENEDNKPSNEEKQEELLYPEEYSFIYYNDDEPSIKAEIKTNKSEVNFNYTYSCDEKDCEPTTGEKTVKFSNNNMNKLKSYLKNSSFYKEGTEIHSKNLSEKDRKVMNSISINEYYFEVEVEDYKYKHEYYYSLDTTLDLYLKEDDSVLVKKLNFKNNEIYKIDTYKLNFKDLTIIKEFIKNNSDIVYKHADQEKMVQSIINNDEKYLEGINKDATIKYIIRYNGVNCPTPVLMIFSDNNFDYYSSFSTDNRKNTPMSGINTFDIESFISRSSNKANDKAYIISANDKQYYMKENDQEFNNFLSSINVKLNVCLENQE